MCIHTQVESVVLFWVLLRDVLLRMMPSARIPYDGTATFADIGCGSGRALVAAALLPFILSADDGNDDGNDDEDNAESAEASFFAQCYGVEILAPLAEAAVTAGEKLAAMGEVIDDGMNYVDNVARRGGKLLVECGKLEESIESWAGCDVVYAASTCFSKALLGAVIENAAQNMRPGALLISLRMPDQDTEYARTLARAFEPEVSLGPYFMSWGSSVVHCFVKK
jgi:SAM-dependent methyltransferase